LLLTFARINGNRYLMGFFFSIYFMSLHCKHTHTHKNRIGKTFFPLMLKFLSTSNFRLYWAKTKNRNNSRTFSLVVLSIIVHSQRYCKEKHILKSLKDWKTVTLSNFTPSIQFIQFHFD
jgi:hypothetical protein